ncbi:MAG: hypothetical protein WBL45_04160 [Solirubrobacterales bacterium]
MPSASRPLTRLAVAACCGSLLLGAAAGCSTTQEKAAKHQAEAKRILDERAKRKKQRDKGDKQGKADDNRGGGQ